VCVNVMKIFFRFLMISDLKNSRVLSWRVSERERERERELSNRTTLPLFLLSITSSYN